MFHLIRVTHHFYFRGHLCIATELLGMNLYELIKTNEFRGFPISLIRKYCPGANRLTVDLPDRC